MSTDKSQEPTIPELSVIVGLAGDPFTEEIVYPSSESTTFHGWDKEIPSEFPNRNMSFYPILGNNSSIIFKADPGQFENGKKYLTYIGEISTETNISSDPPPDPMQTGYEFTGWDKEFPETFLPENIEINSTWKANTSNLKFDYNGGKIGSATSSSAVAVYDSPWPTAPSITTPKSYTVSFVTAGIGSTVASSSTFNCTFNGYWSSSSSSGEKYYNESRQAMTSAFRKTDKDLSAYAGWTNQRAPASGNFADLTLDGYTFGGWYSDVNRTNRVYNFNPLTSNATIYAKWTQITSSSVTNLNISKSDTKNIENSSGTWSYTLTVPTTNLASIPSTHHLKKIYLTLYVYTNNSKQTTISATFPPTNGQTRSTSVAKSGKSSTLNTTIEGNYTGYKKTNPVNVALKFYLEKPTSGARHKANFKVTITRLDYGL